MPTKLGLILDTLQYVKCQQKSVSIVFICYVSVFQKQIHF